MAAGLWHWGDRVVGTLVSGNTQAVTAQHLPPVGVLGTGLTVELLLSFYPKDSQKLRLIRKVLIFKCWFQFF